MVLFFAPSKKRTHSQSPFCPKTDICVTSIKINYTAVLVAAAAQYVLGGLWYTAFAGTWAPLAGITPETVMKMNTGILYGLTFAAQLICCYVLAHFVHYTNSRTTMQGLMTGFWSWLGFTATVLFVTYGWSNRSFTLWAIDAGNNLIGFVAAGMILARWKRKDASAM